MPNADALSSTGLQPGRLIIVCGLPGSGKTTAATALAQQFRGVILGPDDWLTALNLGLWDSSMRERVEALQWTLAKQLLAVGTTVIVEWGSWSRAERDDLRTQARELGAYVELRYLDVPVDELWRRIQDRGRENPPIRRLDIDQWLALFEPPDADELRSYDNDES